MNLSTVGRGSVLCQYFFCLGHIYAAISHAKKGGKINFKQWASIETIGIQDFSMNFKRRGIASYLQERRDILIINLYCENLFADPNSQLEYENTVFHFLGV